MDQGNAGDLVAGAFAGTAGDRVAGVFASTAGDLVAGVFRKKLSSMLGCGHVIACVTVLSANKVPVQLVSSRTY